MTDAETADLVVRARAGDAGAFEDLVCEFHPLTYRWALVAADDPDDAEDVAQTVWIRVHRSLGAYRGEAKFATWLYRITFNAASELSRTRNRQSVALKSWSDEAVREATNDADRDQDARRLAGVIHSLLGDLPPRQRAIFTLADLDGVPAKEIAERLEMPEVTVRTNLLKARRAIRKRLLDEAPQLIEEYRS